MQEKGNLALLYWFIFDCNFKIMQGWWINFYVFLTTSFGNRSISTLQVNQPFVHRTIISCNLKEEATLYLLHHRTAFLSREREGEFTYNRWTGLTVFILACTSSKKAEHFIVPPLVAIGAALLPLLLLQKYIINAAGKLKQ